MIYKSPEFRLKLLPLLTLGIVWIQCLSDRVDFKFILIICCITSPIHSRLLLNLGYLGF